MALKFITCRNLDFLHFDKDGEVTGLNVVVSLQPKGKYRSVNIADAVTNCYVAYDDAADCYVDGKLHEKAVPKADSTRDYRMGFGHGYSRYNTLITSLDAFRTENGGFTSLMSTADAADILASVYQVSDKTDLTSQTQYSVIYRNEHKSALVRIMEEPEHAWEFSALETGWAEIGP